MILLIITCCLYLALVFLVAREISLQTMARLGQAKAAAQAELDERLQRKTRFVQERKDSENVAADIFTLYDMTKEIAKHMTEDEALRIFKEGLRDNFYYEECLLLEPLAAEARTLKPSEGWALYPCGPKPRI